MLVFHAVKPRVGMVKFIKSWGWKLFTLLPPSVHEKWTKSILPKRFWRAMFNLTQISLHKWPNMYYNGKVVAIGMVKVVPIEKWYEQKLFLIRNDGCIPHTSQIRQSWAILFTPSADQTLAFRWKPTDNKFLLYITH